MHADRQKHCDSDADEAEFGDDVSTESKRFKRSEEGKAFLETVFGSRLEYTTWKTKVAKYGQLGSKRTMCPELSPVVAAMLLRETVKYDMVTKPTYEVTYYNR